MSKKKKELIKSYLNYNSCWDRYIDKRHYNVVFRMLSLSYTTLLV